jgi:hypothetical protein
LHAQPPLARGEPWKDEAEDQRAVDGVDDEARPAQAAQRAACLRVNA